MRYEMRGGGSGEEGDMEEGPSLAGSGIEPQHRGHTAGESSNPIALDIDLNLRPLHHRPRCRPRCCRIGLDPLDPLSGPVENWLGRISSSRSSRRFLPGNLVAVTDPPVAESLARMSSLMQEESMEESREEQPPLARNPVGLGPELDALLQESVTEAAIEAWGTAGPFVSRDHFIGGSSLVEMREPLRILRRMGEELPLSPPRNSEYPLSNTGSSPSRARSRWQWHHMRRSRHGNTDFPVSDTTVPTQSDCSLKPEEIADEPDDAPQKSVNFDCNICLETAKDDPIVTLCGHLFCWPCLYQWLYVHSLERKCPVCKALISEKNIIPIYGRGKAEIATNNKDKRKGSLVIPPRPHAPVPSETQERVLSSSGQSSRGLPVNNGMPGDAISNAVSQVLDRLQVAQRLQRQRLEARLQARQRFAGRHIRLSNNSNSNNSGTGLARDRNPTRLQMPVNVEARITSMDSLLLNFHPLGRSNSGNNPHEILEQVAELNELTNDRESDQASSPSRSCQRGVDTASGSSNADPELLHVRKRRRLN